MEKELPGQNNKSEPAPDSVSQNGEQQKEEYLFFNVMPKIKVDDKVVGPTLEVQKEQAPAGQDPALQASGKKFGKIAAIAAAVILLAAAAYFGINYYFGKSGESDIVVNDPGQEALLNDQAGQQEQLAQQAVIFSTTPEWRLKYFNSESCENPGICGDDADPDRDGLQNLEEYRMNTDPNNPDSDQDNLADGDEVKIFYSDPLNSHTAGNMKYSDADFLIGGYSIQNPDRQYTSEEKSELSKRMAELMLHQPTAATLIDVLMPVYGFGAPLPANEEKKPEPEQEKTDSALEGFDLSMEAKQDRDAQRSNTIKTLGIALVKYHQDNQSYPQTGDFKAMHDAVKPYLRTATNPADPVNKEPYVYSYAPNETASDFTLSFYSEVAGQQIKKRAADSVKDKNSEEAAFYDDQRRNDLESLRVALLLYSNNHAGGDLSYVFPTEDKYKTELVPNFISTIPKDPKNGSDYEYKVSETFSSFTIKAAFDNPKSGTTGYLCNQEECREY